MKRLGVVTSRYGQSCLVVCGEESIRDPSSMLNAKTIDQKLSPVGKIVNVFGSEKQVYYLIRFFREFDKSRLEGLINQKIYVF